MKKLKLWMLIIIFGTSLKITIDGCMTLMRSFFLGDYTKLKKNYLPHNYLEDASDYDVVAAVHVEAEWDRNDQVGETKWLQKINKTSGMPNAIVGHVWLSAANC